MPPLLGSEEAGLGSVLTAAGGTAGSAPASGDPLIVGQFSGVLITDAGGATSTYLGDPGSQPALAANSSSSVEYPTGARTIETIRVCSESGNGATPYTVTLYRRPAGGALTPTTQTVTVPGGAAVGATFADSAHPIAFDDGDTYAILVESAATGEGNKLVQATLEGLTSASAISAVRSVRAGSSGLMVVVPTTGDVVVDTGQLFVNGINTGAAQLATLPSADYNTGQLCWVNSVGAYFQLQVSALATDGITIVAASGSPTRRWLRINQLNRVWAAQASWTVNTTTGSDENAGTVGAPLATLSEVARRLAFAMINSAIAVTIIGSQVASDMACFSCVVNTAAGGFVSISYTPTTIYTGVVTTYTAPTPAPSTDDPQLHDAGVTGGSFTAAGLLAAGVIGTTTTGTPLTFFFAKDLGGTTARTSMPFTGSADGALVAGQGYLGQQLPTGRQIRFSDQSPGAFLVSNALFPAGTTWFDQSVFFQHCWFSGFAGGPLVFINCAFSGAGIWNGTASNNFGFILNSGMLRGTGSTGFTLLDCLSAQTNFTLTIQGGSFISQTSSCTFQGDVRVYDFAGAAGTASLMAIYWGFIVWSTGAFAGSNNSSIAFVSKMSQIGHVANPAWVAGSSTSGTPITIAGTGSISVASETAGGGVVNTQQNGVYRTS